MRLMQPSRETDWFHRLTGFQEADYESTQRQLEVDGETLRSKVNGRSYAIGMLETPSLEELRSRVTAIRPLIAGSIKLSTIAGEARALHASDAYTGALFQVASQFNL